jgi:hypothetical protein
MRTAEHMDSVLAVVRDGDRVTASGRVLRDETGDWFEPPLPVAAAGAPRRVRPASRLAVRIVGADFDGLSGRFEREAAVEGYAMLTGIWAAGQLRVEHQAPPERHDGERPRWQVPPCPPPEGGWPRPTWGSADKILDYDLGNLRETGVAVAVTSFRPSENLAVLVVAASDPDVVEAQLRPQLGQLLCVIRSKWTRDELEAVRAHLKAHHEDWYLYRWGYTTASDGQGQISARLTRMLPEVSQWASALPAGILRLQPWLARVTAATTL